MHSRQQRERRPAKIVRNLGNYENTRTCSFFRSQSKLNRVYILLDSSELTKAKMREFVDLGLMGIVVRRSDIAPIARNGKLLLERTRKEIIDYVKENVFCSLNSSVEFSLRRITTASKSFLDPSRTSRERCRGISAWTRTLSWSFIFTW